MEEILKNFKVKGQYISCEPYGEGHINDTYLVLYTKQKYILQRINHHVFPNVKGLMNNIYLVTSYLKDKLNNGDDFQTLTLVLTKENQYYFYDKNTQNYYRLYLFVEHSLTLQKAENMQLFKESAIAFAKFQNLLKDFDATQLIEVIPNFHHTQSRFEHLLKTIQEDPLKRVQLCLNEIDFVLKRKEDCSIIVNLLKEKKLPLKVTHNDTKLNNVLLDNKTLKGMCVIDLDTVMPGTILYDFGDSIRFGCNSASEDEIDLNKVNFKIDYFKAFAEGFLSETKDSLNEYEINYLAFASKIMTLECGIRFLDDYIAGDHYFKIHREQHNLDRCRTQFKLVSQMEEKMTEMNQIIQEIIK